MSLKKAIVALKQDFESSATKTPQYLSFHRLFKREMTALLKSIGCTEISIGKPNHFDVSGFFRTEAGQIWYFSLEDLRWSKDSLLVRTAKHFKDYTGGMNRFVPLNNDFDEKFCKIVCADH